MSSNPFEELEKYFPQYLTAIDKKQLYKEIKDFPKNKEFYIYLQNYEAQALQGDGWKSFLLINIETIERKKVSGIVISNSCDIDPANGIRDGQKILFAPLIKLSRYEEGMKESNLSDTEITQTISNIRSQLISHIFYLPEYPGHIEESIVLLDDINSNPLQHFLQNREHKLFCLNQFAFYLFIIKLSIHFTRLREGLRRYTE